MQVFDGRLSIAYSQAYVASAPDRPTYEDVEGFTDGQRNGLLGAAREGLLWLTTGTQDGEVGLTVHVVECEPPLDESWEECVEASFSPATPVVAVFDWDRNVVCEIPLGERTYRVRYTARGMDYGHTGKGDRDVYGLWFWPAAGAPDAVVKQTSKSAAYWHEMADTEQCEICHGLGRLVQRWPDVEPNWREAPACPTCNGRGRVKAKHR